MKTVRELYDRGVQNGVPDLQILDKRAVHEIEPALAETVVGALFAPTGGIVCPYGLTIAAAGNAMDNGAELCTNFEVTSIEKDDAYYTLNAADGRSVQARFVVNSAGLFSDAIAAMVGDTSFHVHPRSGEYMILDKGERPVSATARSSARRLPWAKEFSFRRRRTATFCLGRPRRT